MRRCDGALRHIPSLLGARVQARGKSRRRDNLVDPSQMVGAWLSGRDLEPPARGILANLSTEGVPLAGKLMTLLALFGRLALDQRPLPRGAYLVGYDGREAQADYGRPRRPPRGRSEDVVRRRTQKGERVSDEGKTIQEIRAQHSAQRAEMQTARYARTDEIKAQTGVEPGPCLDYMNDRSEEHTSELQSRQYLVCRLLLEKK